MINCAASTLQNSAVTDRVAEDALDVALEAVSDVDNGAPSKQVSSLVAATVDVFRGVAQHLKTKTDDMREDTIERVKRTREVSERLNTRADEFCNAVTNNSASGAAAVSSASNDFVFNCQKNEQRGNAVGESTDQVACPYT